MDELRKFIKDALATNQSRDEITRVLSEAGWGQEEIHQALGRFAEVSFPIPVPVKKPAASARDAFLYLVTFAALYTCAIGLNILLFGLTNHYLPDRLTSYDYGPSDADSLRWGIASVFVGFPIFLAMTRKHWRDYASDSERLNSPVRKWLTYVTLTLVSVVLITTAVDLVANVIGGSIALAFFLKIASVSVTAGGIFLYYVWELRWKQAAGK